MSQEQVFVSEEANAWFRRNSSASVVAASSEEIVLKSIASVDIPASGTLIDVGGGAGRIAEGFRRQYPGWDCKVFEPSLEAISAGQSLFSDLEFRAGSICQPEGIPWQGADMIVVSGVFCWVDRELLSRAVCNVDSALKNGGLLVITDFDSPSMRRNPYKYYPEIYTYKQDYAGIFPELGIYHLVYQKSEVLDNSSGFDKSDYYDRQWVTSILKKDVTNRYFMATKETQ